MTEIVFATATADASSDRFGWASLDRYVLGALSAKADCAAHQVAPHLPFPVVRMSLRLLEEQGLVERRTVRTPVDPTALLVRLGARTVWDPTDVGLALLGGVRKVA